MGVDERVIVFAQWHSMCGMRGMVTSTKPLYVLIDGDRLPMRIEERAVVAEDGAPTEPNMSGAE